MSRIGKRPVSVPAGVTASVEGKTLNVNVVGQIVPRCEIQGGGDIDFGGCGN